MSESMDPSVPPLVIGCFPAKSVTAAAALLLVALMLMPILVIGSALFSPDPVVWAQVRSLLPLLLCNTVVLGLGVTAGAGLLGAGLAWLTTLHRFPGRNLFNSALVLPLTIPPYVLGFVLLGVFDDAGPLHTFWRAGSSPEAWFPAIRSTGGVIAVLTLTLYPYVYLLARKAFSMQSISTVEAAHSLGSGGWEVFFRVSLPLTWPWIGSALLLVFLQTVADLGVVSAFGYETFVTAIYKTWSGPAAALPVVMHLASFLLLIALLACGAEQFLRARRRCYRVVHSRDRRLKRLRGWRASLAVFASASVLVLAFIAPILQLLIWGVGAIRQNGDVQFLASVWNSLTLAATGAVVVVTAAFVLSWFKHRRPAWPSEVPIRLASLSYVLPGAALAVGVFVPLAGFDKAMTDLLGRGWHQVFSPDFVGGLAALMLAYLVRFLAPGLGVIGSALARLTPTMEEVARSLGVRGYALFRRLYAPGLRKDLFGASCLAAVGIARELPITLMLRPDGWDTLAVRIFVLAMQGNWQAAAPPALLLVGVGLMSVELLKHAAERPS